LNFNPTRLSRWLRRLYFREALEEMRGQMRRRLWIELELLARSAQNTLRAMHQGNEKANGLTMAICRVILEEHHRAFQRRRQRRADRRRFKRKPSPLDLERDLVHPSMKQREKELLELLRRESE
jgi:hypothetical protein